MKKVEKISQFEITAHIKEIFEGETIEEATQKAHQSKIPSENAEILDTDSKFITGNIKKIGAESENSNVEQQ
jgi:hypothetical protein|tara:strand:+ start:520 stop:735 length:216 start_codon:yes stop_codon:yes gene_type:complete